VTLHNVVEGLAVVATFAEPGSSIERAWPSRSLSDIPEGLAVAELRRRVRPPHCAAAPRRDGEPLGAIAAIVVCGLRRRDATRVAAAVAAGAMIVLAATDLIPEAFSHSFVAEASVGLLAGILVALVVMAIVG
jgi:zinc transporter ZupT